MYRLFENPDEFLRRVLVDDAGRLQQEHERRGAAIHDRQFRRIDLDERIVDAESCKRRHQVFDRRNPHLPRRQRGRHRRIADVSDKSRNQHRRTHVYSTEYDSRIHRRRAQRHDDFLAGMHTDPGGTNRVLQCSLIDHRRRVEPISPGLRRKAAPRGPTRMLASSPL